LSIPDFAANALLWVSLFAIAWLRDFYKLAECPIQPGVARNDVRRTAQAEQCNFKFQKHCRPGMQGVAKETVLNYRSEPTQDRWKASMDQHSGGRVLLPISVAMALRLMEISGARRDFSLIGKKL
jgi:hypothetical protein